MFAKLCALRNKKGFTLAELLIVVAIVGVLVAIAIPIFSSSLNDANDAVMQANYRSAKAVAAVETLKAIGDDGNIDTVTYKYEIIKKTNEIILTKAEGADGPTDKYNGFVKITATDLP